MRPVLNAYSKLPKDIELCEATYWGKLYEPIKGVNSYKTKIAGATVCALPQIDTLAMNRVIGWGWESMNLEKELNELITIYRANNCNRFMIQLSPLIPNKPQAIAALKKKGFRLHNYWSKLWRPIAGYIPLTKTFFQTRLIEPDQARLYGQLIVQSFDWPEPCLISWLAASVGKPGYRHYIVWDQDKPIAAGALHLSGIYASLAFAGTLPEYRGMGAQSLLIHQRLKDAYNLKARYVIVETAAELPNKPVASFRNMQKFGFDLAYQRANWVYEF